MSFPWNNYQRGMPFPLQQPKVKSTQHDFEANTCMGETTQVKQGNNGHMINSHNKPNNKSKGGFLVSTNSQLPHHQGLYQNNIPNWNVNVNHQTHHQDNKQIQWNNDKGQIIYQQPSFHPMMIVPISNNTVPVQYVSPTIQDHNNFASSNVDRNNEQPFHQINNHHPQSVHYPTNFDSRWNQPDSTMDSNNNNVYLQQRGNIQNHKAAQPNFPVWNNQEPSKIHCNQFSYHPLAVPFKPDQQTTFSPQLLPPPPPPPPPLPQEKPPPPPPFLPIYHHSIDTDSPMLHNSKLKKEEMNVLEKEKIFTESQQHSHQQLVLIDVDQDKDVKCHNAVETLNMPKKIGKASSDDNHNRIEDLYQDDHSIPAIENNNMKERCTSYVVENSKFEDALTELQGLSKKWTSTKPTTFSSPTKKSRNQKKKEKKKQRRKEERMKLLELIRDNFDLDKTKQQINESETDNNDTTTRGYQNPSQENNDNFFSHEKVNNKKEESILLYQNKNYENGINVQNLSEEPKVDESEMEISDGEEVEDKTVVPLVQKTQFVTEQNNVLLRSNDDAKGEDAAKKELPTVDTKMDTSWLKSKVFIVKTKHVPLQNKQTMIVEEQDSRDKAESPMSVSGSTFNPTSNWAALNQSTSKSNPTSLTSSGGAMNQESLLEKKERLARALKRVAFEKAKAKLKIAQKRKQQMLATTTSIQEINDEASCHSNLTATSEVTKPKISKTGIFGKISHPSSPIRRSDSSSYCIELEDITACRIPNILIRNISSSGPSEKIRVISIDPSSLVAIDELNVSNCPSLDVDNKEIQKQDHDSPGRPKPVENPSINELNEHMETLSTTKNDRKKCQDESQIGATSKKKNLEILKCRLRLKLLEKARIERKRKYIANNTEPVEKKILRGNATTSGVKFQALTEDMSKNDTTHVSLPKQEKSNEEMHCVNERQNVEESSEQIKVSPGSTLEESKKQYENSTVSTMRDFNSYSSKKDILSVLKERQRVLKDNIDTSKSNQRELKYDMDLSNLNTLVNRQREILAKQAKKVSKNSKLLKECCEEIENNKTNLALAERRIQDLQKRKRIMEKMLLSVTRKVVDGRRRRDELLQIKAKSKGNRSLHPNLENLDSCIKNDKNIRFARNLIKPQRPVPKN